MKIRRRGPFLIGFAASLIVGGLLIAFILATSTPALTHIQAVMAHGLDDEYRPVNPAGEFAPDDIFYLSVRVENAPPHSIISARWYYGQSVIMTDDQVIGAASPVYVVGFELRRADEPWPVGAYHVAILLNGEEVGSARFTVVGEPG